MELIIVILSIVLLFCITLIFMYNKLLRLKNIVRQSQSAIDVYLNQRFDLIPNLVECVKAYAKYEKDVFENIIKLRNSYNQASDDGYKQANEINKEINKIIAIAEGYPEVKASEQYLNLQKSLEKIESQLQAARRVYNSDVTSYNTSIESIPNNIFAKIFGFKRADLFQVEEFKKENINIGKML